MVRSLIWGLVVRISLTKEVTGSVSTLRNALIESIRPAPSSLGYAVPTFPVST